MKYPKEFDEWFVNSKVSYRGYRGHYETNKENCFLAWKAGRNYEKHQKYVSYGYDKLREMK
jgi:hypothetical protein